MKNSVFSAFWTFPSVLFAAFMMAWGAEAAQFLISQGLALAILAWLQTMPEFAVEAAIAWKAGKDPSLTHLVIANFTGSIRLLVGLGWPMIGLIASFFRWKRGGRFFEAIRLEEEHSIEIFGMLIPMLYFLVIWAKGTLNILDGSILIFVYLTYLMVLLRLPHQHEEGMDDLAIPSRWALKGSGFPVKLKVLCLLGGGGVLIFLVVEPFLESMEAIALSLGIPMFFFVQWLAPFLSEFPEKLSAFYWAKQVTKAPMGIMNFVSSNINQWSVLSGIIPFVFVISSGKIQPIVLDSLQRNEIMLTFAQSLYAFVILLDMEFSVSEAIVLFGLFLTQFLLPSTREMITLLYFLASALVFIKLLVEKKGGRSVGALRHVWQSHLRKLNR